MQKAVKPFMNHKELAISNPRGEGLQNKLAGTHRVYRSDYEQNRDFRQLYAIRKTIGMPISGFCGVDRDTETALPPGTCEKILVDMSSTRHWLALRKEIRFRLSGRYVPSPGTGPNYMGTADL